MKETQFQLMWSRSESGKSPNSASHTQFNVLEQDCFITMQWSFRRELLEATEEKLPWLGQTPLESAELPQILGLADWAVMMTCIPRQQSFHQNLPLWVADDAFPFLIFASIRNTFNIGRFTVLIMSKDDHARQSLFSGGTRNSFKIGGLTTHFLGGICKK